MDLGSPRLNLRSPGQNFRFLGVFVDLRVDLGVSQVEFGSPGQNFGSTGREFGISGSFCGSRGWIWGLPDGIVGVPEGNLGFTSSEEVEVGMRRQHPEPIVVAPERLHPGPGGKKTRNSGNSRNSKGSFPPSRGSLTVWTCPTHGCFCPPSC